MVTVIGREASPAGTRPPSFFSSITARIWQVPGGSVCKSTASRIHTSKPDRSRVISMLFSEA
jgi:hypothetical protein